MQYSLACLHIGWGHDLRARELLLECIGAFERLKVPRLAVAYESLAHVEEREGRVSFALNELGESRQDLGKVSASAAWGAGPEFGTSGGFIGPYAPARGS